MRITRDPEYRLPPPNMFGLLGRRAILTCRGAGRSLLMLAEAVLQVRYAFARRARREIVVQMFIAGIKSLGVISVVANIVPADVKAMTDLILEGDLVSARKWHRKLFVLSKSVLSMATNPIPIKAAMAHALGTHLDLFQRIVVSPCSVSAILRTPGGPIVLAVNSTGDDLRGLVPS